MDSQSLNMFRSVFATPTPSTPQEIYRSSFIGDEAMEKLVEELEHPSSGNDPTNDIVLMTAQLSFMTMNDPTTGASSLNPTVHTILDEHGCFEIPCDPPSFYLENNIHRIFRRENFDSELTIAGDAWETMLPALTLATKFITAEQFRGWWAHVLYGTLTTDSATGKRYLAESPKEAFQWQSSVDVAAHWRLLSKSIAFYWAPCKLKRLEHSILGLFQDNRYSALWSLGGSDDLRQQGRKAPFDAKIGLCSSFLYHLISPVSRSRQGPCAKLRLQFLVATVIMHELAHAFYALRQFHCGHSAVAEPYVFLKDALPEVGVSWESWTCGITSWNFSDLKSVPFIFASSEEYSWASPSLRAPVDMQWIQAWFRKDTWECLDEALAMNLLRAPRAVGRPTLFMAERYFNKKWYWCFYKHGRLVSPSYLSISSPPSDVCVEAWYKRISTLEVQQAIEDGVSSEEDFVGLYD